MFSLSQWFVTWCLRHQAVTPPQGKRAGRRPSRSLLKPNRDEWIRLSRGNTIRTTTTDVNTENKNTTDAGQRWTFFLISLQNLICPDGAAVTTWWVVPGPGSLGSRGGFVCGILWGCVAAPGTQGFGMKLVLLCSSWAWVSASGPRRSKAGWCWQQKRPG